MYWNKASNSKRKRWGVIALGSPLSPERYALGKATLDSFGIEIEAPISPSEYYGQYDFGFSNGSAQDRAAALLQLLRDDDVECVLTARGGYGCSELLPHLRAAGLTNIGKPVVGLSDATALLVQIPQQFGGVSLHGPALGSAFADYQSNPIAKQSVDSLMDILSEKPSQIEESIVELRSKDAEVQGKLLVGNLSVLVSLLGTPYDVSYKNKILAIEEVGEAPYQVHRLLLQLLYAGKLAELRGLLFGRFAKCESKFGPSVTDVIEQFSNEHLSSFDYPVGQSDAFGHWGLNRVLPIGAKATWSNGALRIQ